ncbi:MAG: phosphotransferase family protein [Gammaproteobacteria bacterium]
MTEGIHAENVTNWLSDRVPALEPPLEFSLIAGGHSNLTYRCEDVAGNAYVLRRPPMGHVLESAHDMGREHKIIDALKDAAVPVPKNYGLCKDKSVNDADFYVMEFIDGLVLNDSTVSVQLSDTDRRTISEDVAEILCQLHAINPDHVGLGDLGRKEAYLARQINRWVKQWEASKTDEIPAMEESCRILQERMPEQVGATIVHGDYRLGNMIVRDGRVQAILDWELCTLGDPLADVGYILNNWVTADEVPEMGENDMSPTAVGGFFTRDEFTDFYASKTGRDLSEINYYRAFSHWRLAAIGQGVYKRYLVGAMGENRDVDIERQQQSVIRRAEAALELLS